MRKKFMILISIFLLVLLIISVSGCRAIGQRSAQKLAETVIERAAASQGEDVSVDLSSGEIKIKSDEGEIAIGGASLPDEWPKEVPVPNNYDIMTSWKSTVDGKSVFSISGNYNGSLSEAVSWYKSELSRGWDIENEFEGTANGSKSNTITATNANYTIAFFGTESDGEVLLVINVESKQN